MTEALRDLARWLYRQLQAEYDHLTSDEAIEEGTIVGTPSPRPGGGSGDPDFGRFPY